MRWKRGSYGQPFRLLDYREGQGRAVSGELPDAEDNRIDIPLKSPDLLAVNALGQFPDHPREKWTTVFEMVPKRFGLPGTCTRHPTGPPEAVHPCLPV